jgi:hypothetical protein
MGKSSGRIKLASQSALWPAPQRSATPAWSFCYLTRAVCKFPSRDTSSIVLSATLAYILKLQNPQLVTSYALPPQTSLSIAPYSLYRKGSSRKPSHRFTYAATTQSAPGEKPQLVCFTEKIQKDAATNTVKTSHTPSSTTERIVAIDCVPISTSGPAKDGDHDVLVVFGNGQLLCLSSNLETTRWKAMLRSYSPGGQASEVEHINLSTAKAVIRGILRSRQDVAAVLDPTLEGESELLDLTQVLSVVSRQSNGSSTLGLFQLQTRSSDLSSSHLPPLKHLSTWTLPSPTSLSISEASKVAYSLHPASGILHQLVDGALISYDFSKTVPTLSSELAAPASSIDSFLHISSDLIFTISRNKCSVLDVRYNSIQALLSLESRPIASPDSKKRKLGEPGSAKEPITTPTLVAHFAEIGLAVGILDQELIGIQLGGSLTRKRQKTENTLLIDSIGKGIPSELTVSKTASGLSKDSSQWQDWQKRVTKLDRYASKGKIARFEEMFAADLGIEVAKSDADDGSEPQTRLKSELETSSLTNNLDHDMDLVGTEGDNLETQLRRWDLPTVIPDAQRHQHQHQATYALSKIFQWAKPSSRKDFQSSLKIDFFPPNVFQWLLLSGYITKESIRRCILEQEPEALEAISSIVDGDIVKAIVEFDPELHLLSAVLNHGHFLPVGEVVQAIKLLVQSLDDQPATGNLPGLLTNGTAPSEDAMDVDSELEAATHDLDHALSLLDHGLSIRSHTLRPALIRLHTFPTPIVSSALRSMLPRRELESLIRLLHLELKNGGWTSQYDFADSETSHIEAASEDPDDHAVAIIASLLSCTLDAIGAGAWVAAVGSPDSTEETIKDLYEDTSEALNGFWEARYMRGLLSEFLRYAANTSKSQKPSTKNLEKAGKPFVVDVVVDEALPMLPLGGKMDQGVEKTKTGKGGKKEERSAREIGMLISKKVPKYSFERIVI